MMLSASSWLAAQIFGSHTIATVLVLITNIKLKNVTLSYTLPSGLKPVSDVLKGARIFVSADNLFTWFKDDWKGYSDIDIFGIGGYNTLTAIPVPTTLTMGFNLTF